MTSRAKAKARLKKITMEELNEDNKIQSQTEENDKLEFIKKTEKIREEMMKLLNKGGYIKIVDDEMYCYLMKLDDDSVESTNAVIKEIEQLRKDGIMVSLEKVVEHLREEYEKPLFSLIGSYGLGKVCVTLEDKDKLVYEISNIEIDKIIEANNEDPKKLKGLRRKKFLELITDMSFLVETGKTVKGLYVPKITKEKDSWVIKIECIVNENGELI